MKGTKRRLLALLLALTMVLGMFPMSAMATETNDTVYISVSFDGQYVNDKTGEPMAYIPVSLSELQAIDLEEYSLTEYDYNGQLTALHLYIYTHEKIMGKDWNDVGVSGGAGSIFFERGLFGFQDCNLQYYCNGKYPEVDGWGVTADQLVLNDGDFVDIAAYTSWAFYFDSAFGFHYFLDNEEIVHEYTATAGEPLTVTLGRGASYMGGEYSMTEVSNYTVSYGEVLGTADGTVTTNKDGQAEITFAEAGTYYLWVNGDYGAENPLDIVSSPGYAKVTVEAAACTHETWTPATCTTPKTCADCGATEGEADPEAHSYVNGTCEHCGTAEPVATPSYTIKLSEAEELTAGLNYFISVPAEVLGKDISFDFGSGTIKGAMCQRHCSKRDIWTAGEGSTMLIAADKVAAHLCNESQRAKVASDFNLYLTEGSQMFAFYWWTSANMNGSYIYIEILPAEEECAHETWTPATCTTPKTCANCGATEGEADPDAHNYVNGTCEYCGAAEPVATPSYTIKLSEAEELTAGLNYFISVPAEALGKDISFDFGSGTIKGAMCQRHCSKRDIWTAGEGSTMLIAADKVAAHLCNESQRAKVASDFNLYLTEGSQMFAFYWWTSANMNGSYIYIEILPAEEECAHETWTPATCTTPKTCANCGATEGEADPEAHSYVDGTCEYCGAAKVEAVPFSQTIETPSNGSKVWGYVSSLELSGTDGSVKEYRWASESDPFVLNVVLGEDTDLDATITAKFAITYANDRYVPTLSGEDTVRLENGKGSITVTAVSGKPKSYPDTTWTVKLTVFDPNQTYDVTLPTNNVGFSVRATSSPTVTAGGEFSFKLNIYDDYKKGENFKVKANGVELTSSGDVYTITNITANQTVTVEGVVEKTLAEKNVTVNVPAGSVVSSGAFHSYFKYDFVEPLQISTLEDGRVQYIVPATSGAGGFIRVQNPNGVTYWDFGDLAIGKVFNITEEMLFIGSSEYTKDTVYANYEKNGHDIASLYLTANAQGWLDMATGDTHSLNVFRNWIPVSNSTTNIGVSLPDVTYTVVDVNGNTSDVVTVTPDENNSCYADIKAVKAGTAIILVSYDAVYNADGEGGKQFSAIWPENTGVIVVTVDAEDADIQTNITVNEEANAGGKQILDVEHDILFYVGNTGAEYSFKPEDGCTVTISRSTVGNEMTFNGFTNEDVTVSEDGTVTLSGLTTGAHIVKVEKDGKTAYQVIRAREVSYKLTHSDGTEVTAENPAQPGETITVQFSKLIDPMGKLSGVYNANYGFRYTGENGEDISIKSTSAYGEYYFGSNPARQRLSLTVPADWNGSTYTFTDGGLVLGGWGSTFGGHRSTSYMEGKEPNLNASGTAGVAAVLPDVVIPVDVAPEVDTTLSSYIFNSDIDGTGWGRADAAYADKLTLFGAGVDDLRWDGDTCYVTLDKKTANNAGIGFVITYKANMDSWLDGLKATVNGESMNANEMLFTQLANGTLTAEVYVTNNDIANQSGTKTFVITVADETACDHEWTEANCTVPKTCKLCGVTRGDVVADGHNYVDGKCGYCGNYVGIDIATGDTASGTQDIRISDFYVNAYGAVLSNTIVEDGRATVQIKAPLDELELTISMFGKKGMVLSKAALAINDGEAIAPTSVDKDNNVAEWVGTVTPEWNGNTAEIKFTVGYSSSSGFKSPKEYILTLEKVEETPEPATYTVTLPSGTGYTVAANGESASPVTEGGSYSFTVTISEGYEAGENFAVKANDTKLTAVEGVYTIENITADQTITVEGVVEKQEEPALTWQEVMAMTQIYLAAQAENEAPIVGTNKGEWMVLGLARNGMNADNDIFKGYYDNVVRFVEEKIDAETGRLDKNQATVNARVILGLTSIGKDVTNVAGHNLLKGLSDTDFVKKQGINGPVWALIALDSHDYEIPTNTDPSKQVTREWLINHILDNQLEGGGWKISGNAPDDMTPMAVQALAPYYNSNAEVTAAIDKALTIMEGMVETGSPETLAQIIVARSTMGLDSEEIVNKMLAFALEDGSFKKSPSATNTNQMSTEQAFYSMVAYSRFLNNKTALYDMSDVVIEQPAEQDKPVESVTLSSSTLSMKVGETDTLVALVSPADATNRTVSWSSSNTGVATVSSNGVVTAVAEGSATITATAGEVFASCVVTVTKTSGSGPKLEFGLTEDEIIGYVTVSFEDKGIRKTAELDVIDSMFKKPLGTIIKATKVPFKKGDTIASVTLRLLEEKNFTASYEGTEFGSFYLEAIGDFKVGNKTYGSFGEFDAGQDSGWMITWNDWFIDQGASEFKVKDGDVVRWQYTCQLGKDIGDDGFDRDETGNGGSASVPGVDAEGKDVIVDVKKANDGKFVVEVKVDNEAADKVTGGVVVKIPAKEATSTSVLVIVDDKGNEAIVKKAAVVGDEIVALLDGSCTVVVKDNKKEFTDTEGHWGKAAAEFASSRELFNGVGNGLFGMNTTMNRAMMATVFYNLENGPEHDGEHDFHDVQDGKYYAKPAAWAAEHGVLSGYTDGSFRPDAPITREQLAVMLWNYSGKPEAKKALTNSDAGNISNYAKEAMQWAVENGVMSGRANGQLDPKGAATRAEVAQMFKNYIEKVVL